MKDYQIDNIFYRKLRISHDHDSENNNHMVSLSYDQYLYYLDL